MPTADVNGLQMYYELSGDGPALVLVGGLGLDVSDCRQLTPVLARHYRVLAFDNRGAGRTDKPDEPYTIEQMAGDTAGLMRALSIESAHLLGISLGGRIVLQLALDQPSCARSLVLASTCARVVRRWPTRALGLASGLPGLRGRYPQPRYAFNRQRHASDGFDLTPRLSELQLPVLVVHGRRDHLVPLSLARELADGIAGSELVAVGGGHLYPLLHSEAFVEQVVAFTAATRDR